MKQDFWGVRNTSSTINTRRSVKDEFGVPCWTKYNTALKALKFLNKYHDINDVLNELSKDID